MNIICAICHGIFQPSAYNISTIDCGHVFHSPCLIRWLEISSTSRCPECRQSVNPIKILRLHLNFEEDELVKSKIASFCSQIKLNEAALKKFNDENIELKLQKHHLDVEVESIKKTLNKYASLIHALTKKNSDLSRRNFYLNEIIKIQLTLRAQKQLKINNNKPDLPEKGAKPTISEKYFEIIKNNTEGIETTNLYFLSALSSLLSLKFVQQVTAGDKIPEHLRNLYNLVVRHNSRVALTVPLCKQALENSRKMLGREHPEVASMLNILALAYKNQGYFEEAENLLKEAYAIRRKFFGKGHATVAASLQLLVYFHSERSLMVFKKLFQSDGSGGISEIGHRIVCKAMQKPSEFFSTLRSFSLNTISNKFGRKSAKEYEYASGNSESKNSPSVLDNFGETSLFKATGTESSPLTSSSINSSVKINHNSESKNFVFKAIPYNWGPATKIRKREKKWICINVDNIFLK